MREKVINLNYFDKVIVVPPESDYGMVLFSDIRLIKNASVLDGPIKKSNWILSLFHHIHFSFFLNKHFTLPFQKIWRKLYCFNMDTFESDKKYCVLFSDVSACRVDVGFLKKLSQKENVTLCTIEKSDFASTCVLKSIVIFFTNIPCQDIA